MVIYLAQHSLTTATFFHPELREWRESEENQGTVIQELQMCEWRCSAKKGENRRKIRCREWPRCCWVRE